MHRNPFRRVPLHSKTELVVTIFLGTLLVHIIYNAETFTGMSTMCLFSLTQRASVTNYLSIYYGSLTTMLVIEEGESALLSERLEMQPRLPNVSTFSKRYTLHVMMLW